MRCATCESYRAAIEAVGRSVRAGSPPASWPSVSVKLSALHPRYEYGRQGQVLAELGPRLESLALTARQAGIAMTVDAEEADRLELSLRLIDRLLDAPALAGWDGLGLAVQAYSKRAPDVIRYLQQRADAAGRVLNLRLVKGAYWDSEIKRAQERGLPGYPVYTRKANTDVAYLACARILLDGHAPGLSAVRDAQRAHGGRDHPSRAQSRAGVRVPAPARDGRGALHGADRSGGPRLALPRLRAGRLARGAAAVPRAAAARERREHVVREPHRRRVAAGRGRGRRPGRGRRARR